MSTAPLLTRASQLADHDGLFVALEGTYTPRASQRKMNDPTRYWLGFVDLRLEGGRVQLSSERREDAEVEHWSGRRVRVSGTLVMDRDLGADHARPEPTPTLVDPGVLLESPVSEGCINGPGTKKP